MPYSAGWRVADEHVIDLALEGTQAVRGHDRHDGRQPSGHALDDDELVHLARIADEYFHHEPVHLSLRKLVGAFGLDRVLRGHHEEGVRDLVGLAADRHLPLLHHLEESALDLRWRAVDLVREQEVREHRAERRLEVTDPLVVDTGADKVGGDEVWRELDPLEVAGDRLRDRLHRERLRESGDALDEKVAAREEADQEALQQVILADDHLLDLEEEPAGVGWDRNLGFGHYVPSS